MEEDGGDAIDQPYALLITTEDGVDTNSIDFASGKYTLNEGSRQFDDPRALVAHYSSFEIPSLDMKLLTAVISKPTKVEQTRRCQVPYTTMLSPRPAGTSPR